MKKTNESKRVVIYARVSTLTQKSNETIDTQLKTLRAYCKKAGLTIVHEYLDEGISGASEDRIVSLVKYLQEQSDVDALVFTYIDRIARDTYLQLWLEKECKKLEIELISTEQDLFNNPSNDPMQKAMKEMMAVFASLEKNIITRRLSNGRKHKAMEKGVKSQGNCPFGYDYEGKTTKDKHVTVNTAEAEIVKAIFKTFMETASTTKTANLMNAQGFTNKRGNAFTKQQIQLILKNEFYAGVVTYNDEKQQGQHEAIISKNLFGRVQNLFRK